MADGRKIATVFLALVMLLSSLVFGQASADASDASEFLFAKDEVLRPGESCPEGTRDLGRAVPGRLAVCRPDGFVPIATPAATEAMCDLAREVGVFGVWYEGNPISLCLYAYSTPVPESGCWAARIETTLTDPFTGETTRACVAAVLFKDASASATSAGLSLTPICINDDALLADDDAADLEVGEIFNVRGANYFVTTGGLCGFDCYDGFDVNCDGKLGDFCASEFDRRTVAGAKACLAVTGTGD